MHFHLDFKKTDDGRTHEGFLFGGRGAGGLSREVSNGRREKRFHYVSKMRIPSKVGAVEECIDRARGEALRKCENKKIR